MAPHISDQGSYRKPNDPEASQILPHRAHTRSYEYHDPTRTVPRYVPSIHIADNLLSTELDIAPRSSPVDRLDAHTRTRQYRSSNLVHTWQEVAQDCGELPSLLHGLKLDRRGGMVQTPSTKHEANLGGRESRRPHIKGTHLATTMMENMEVLKAPRTPKQSEPQLLGRIIDRFAASIASASEGTPVKKEEDKEHLEFAASDISGPHYLPSVDDVPTTSLRLSQHARGCQCFSGLGHWAIRDIESYEQLCPAAHAILNHPEGLVPNLEPTKLPEGATSQCGGGSHSESHQAGHASGSSRDQQNNTSSNENGKRTSEINGRGNGGDEGGTGEDGNEDRNGHNRKRLKHNSQPSMKCRWYACPFHKHDPVYFSANDTTEKEFKVCESRGWKKINQLKEHIYRKHLNPPRCNRCQQVFDTAEAVAVHDRQTTRCELAITVELRGISSAVRDQLKKKRRPGTPVSDEERWFEIYRLLFPNDELPASPYSEIHDHAFVESLERGMPRLLRSKLDISLANDGFTKEQIKRIKNIVVDEVSAVNHEILNRCHTVHADKESLVSSSHEKDDHNDDISYENLLDELFEDAAWDESLPATVASLPVEAFIPENTSYSTEMSRPRYRRIAPSAPATDPNIAIPTTPANGEVYNTHSRDSALGSDMQSRKSEGTPSFNSLLTYGPQNEQQETYTAPIASMLPNFDNNCPEITNYTRPSANLPMWSGVSPIGQNPSTTTREDTSETPDEHYTFQ